MPSLSLRLAAGWDRPSCQDWCRALPALADQVDPVKVIHQGRNRLFRAVADGREVVVKEFRYRVWCWSALQHLVRHSKARRSFAVAESLLARGIGTPQPIAWCEEWRWRCLRRAFYVSVWLENAVEARSLTRGHALAQEEALCPQIGSFVAHLHRQRVWHRDLTPGNILMVGPAERCDFHVVDLNRVRLDVELGHEAALANLAMLEIGGTQGRAVVEGYCQARGWCAAEDWPAYERLLLARLRCRERRKRIRAIRAWFRG